MSEFLPDPNKTAPEGTMQELNDEVGYAQYLAQAADGSRVFNPDKEQRPANLYTEGTVGSKEFARVGGTDIDLNEPRVVVQSGEGGRTVDALSIKALPDGNGYRAYETHVGGGEDKVQVTKVDYETGQEYTHTFKDPKVAKKFGTLVARHVQKLAKSDINKPKAA